MGETEGRVQRPGQGLSGIGKNQDCGGSTLHHTAPSSLRQQALGLAAPSAEAFRLAPNSLSYTTLGPVGSWGVCTPGVCVGGCQEDRLGKWGGWEILSEGCLAPRAEVDSEACVYPTPLRSPRLTVPRLQEN